MDGTRRWGVGGGRAEGPGVSAAAPRRGRRWIVAASAPLLAATLMVGVAGPQPVAASCGSLQSRINAAHVGSTLRLTGCTFSGSATIRKRITIVGGTIRVPAGRAGLTIKANDVTISGVHLIGSTRMAFRRGEVGVFAVGSRTSPIRRLTIRGSDIGTFGDTGVLVRNTVSLRVTTTRLHDIVYAGIRVLSGQSGLIDRNAVQRIGVHGASANSGNAYGIVLESVVNGNLSANPPTSDFIVRANTVEDVPTWHALDTHNGLRITFSGNTVRRSMRAIFITTDNDGNGSRDITVSGNHLLAPSRAPGSIRGITLYRASRVHVIKNVLSGWGSRSPVYDYGGESSGVVISGNIVHP